MLKCSLMGKKYHIYIKKITTNRDGYWVEERTEIQNMQHVDISSPGRSEKASLSKSGLRYEGPVETHQAKKERNNTGTGPVPEGILAFRDSQSR